MAFTYTQSELRSRINANIHGKIGMLISDKKLMNSAARRVFADADIRSSRRRADIQPKLFEDVFIYQAPADLKGYALIDTPPQAEGNTREWFFVPSEEFYRLKERKNNMVSIDDFNGIRRLLLSSTINDTQKVISNLDSVTSGGGTWQIFGDAENITFDSSNYIKGSKSLNFDISSDGGTTAGIQNTGLNPFDIDDDYLDGQGALFAWVYLSDKDNIANFKMRLGSSISDYNEQTITSAHDNTSFITGWNLLRFDLSSMSQTGTPNNDEIDYVALFMTKDTSKISETDFRFDYIILRCGKIHQVYYYSKYPWQSSSGTYKENSTDSSDLLVADTDEFDLIVNKGSQLAAQETKDFDTAKEYERMYKEDMALYKILNPSEAKVMTNEYHTY